MASALARSAFPHIYVRSAGIEPGNADPFAATVMAELGHDITGHAPHTLDELGDTGFDLVITLAPEAHHHVLELARTQSFDVEYWPTPDPSGDVGSRSQILESYRACRDTLARQIKARFGA